MSIHSKLSGAVSDFLNEKGVKIKDEKKGKFSSLINSIEKDFDHDLENAVNSVREKLARINDGDGFGMSYEYVDRILKKTKISLQ